MAGIKINYENMFKDCSSINLDNALPKKVQEHRDIVLGLNKLYADKNADYGDSVHDTYMKYGLTSFLVRLEDKLNRARTLATKTARVTDEKLEDTLLDMANYAILAVIELRNDQERRDIDGSKN